MKKLNNKGFTLVELIVVIVILAVLSGISIMYYGYYITEAKTSIDIQTCNNIKEAFNQATFEDGIYEEIQNAFADVPSNRNNISYLIVYGATSKEDIRYKLSISEDTSEYKKMTVMSESDAESRDFEAGGRFSLIGKKVDDIMTGGFTGAKSGIDMDGKRKQLAIKLSIYRNGTIKIDASVV